MSIPTKDYDLVGKISGVYWWDKWILLQNTKKISTGKGPETLEPRRNDLININITPTTDALVYLEVPKFILQIFGNFLNMASGIKCCN